MKAEVKFTSVLFFYRKFLEKHSGINTSLNVDRLFCFILS